MKKKKILVIDDFIPLLEEVVEFLAYEGYQTYSAKDGTEGVQMAIQHEYQQSAYDRPRLPRPHLHSRPASSPGHHP